MLRFARMHQKPGDPRRSWVVVAGHTFTDGMRSECTAFECHPRFESLLKNAPQLLESLRNMILAVKTVANEHPEDLLLGTEYWEALRIVESIETSQGTV